MMGATRDGELRRSAELFESICKEQNPYFALAFIYDLGYGREEIRQMLEIMRSTKCPNIKSASTKGMSAP